MVELIGLVEPLVSARSTGRRKDVLAMVTK